MESKDYPNHINFTDAQRTESFVLCALQALRTTNSVSNRCGFDIATRPELCLMYMKDLLPKLDDLMRLSKMASANEAGQIASIAHDLLAMALALRSGALKSLNLPRESSYVPPSHRQWHLRLTGSSDTIFTGSLTNVINYADDVLSLHGDSRDGIEIAEVVFVYSPSSLFFVSDVASNLSNIFGGQEEIPSELMNAIEDDSICDSLHASVSAVMGQFLPLKAYRYGRTCILSNLSEVDGKYVDKSNGMVLGEIEQ